MISDGMASMDDDEEGGVATTTGAGYTPDGK